MYYLIMGNGEYYEYDTPESLQAEIEYLDEKGVEILDSGLIPTDCG